MEGQANIKHLPVDLVSINCVNPEESIKALKYSSKKLSFNNIYLFTDENITFEYETIKIEITKNLRCLVCQGQSIYDSDSEFANSIKLVVDKKLNEGSTKKEIYEFLKTKYGDWILYDPKWTKNTYLLWLIPILIFLFGGFLIFKKLKIK